MKKKNHRTRVQPEKVTPPDTGLSSIYDDTEEEEEPGSEWFEEEEEPSVEPLTDYFDPFAAAEEPEQPGGIGIPGSPSPAPVRQPFAQHEMEQRYNDLEQHVNALTSQMNQIAEIINRFVPLAEQMMGGGLGGMAPQQMAQQPPVPQRPINDFQIGSGSRDPFGGIPIDSPFGPAPQQPQSEQGMLPATVPQPGAMQPPAPQPGLAGLIQAFGVQPGGGNVMSTITTLIQIAKELGIIGASQPQQQQQTVAGLVQQIQPAVQLFSELAQLQNMFRQQLFADINSNSQFMSRMVRSLGREAIVGTEQQPQPAEQQQGENIGGFRLEPGGGK